MKKSKLFLVAALMFAAMGSMSAQAVTVHETVVVTASPAVSMDFVAAPMAAVASQAVQAVQTAVAEAPVTSLAFYREYTDAAEPVAPACIQRSRMWRQLT